MTSQWLRPSLCTVCDFFLSTQQKKKKPVFSIILSSMFQFLYLTEILFLGERLSGGNRVTTGWYQLYVTSHSRFTPPSQTMSAERRWNSSLRPKYRAKRFLNDVYASGDLLLCKFSQHYVNLKCVAAWKDHLLSKARMERQGKTL